MNIDFEGEIIYWRGPAPFLFVAVPPEQSEAIKLIAAQVSYGWGCIPVRARIGETEWKTSLFPKNGLYLVPIKVLVQRAEGLDVGDHVAIWLEIG
jgi:hypothetical protein